MNFLGLVAFLLVCGVNTALLSLDYYLQHSSFKTLSQLFVENPWLGIVAIAFQMVAPLGLSIHLYLPEFHPG
jgi:hypothetical protein